MDKLSMKAGYLRGLVDGAQLKTDDFQAKFFRGMVDFADAVAESVKEIQSRVDEVEEEQDTARDREEGILRTLDAVSGITQLMSYLESLRDEYEEDMDDDDLDEDEMDEDEMDDDDDLKEIFGHFEGETKSDADGELDEDDDAPDPGVVFLHRKKDRKK